MTENGPVLKLFALPRSSCLSISPKFQHEPLRKVFYRTDGNVTIGTALPLLKTMPTIIYVSDPLPGEGVDTYDESHASQRAVDAISGNPRSVWETIGAPSSIGSLMDNDGGHCYISGYQVDRIESDIRSRPLSGVEEDDKDREIERLQAEVKKLERKLGDAVQSAKSFSRQQRKLYDGFKVLRRKYDNLKVDTAVTMWEYIPNKVRYWSSPVPAFGPMALVPLPRAHPPRPSSLPLPSFPAQNLQIKGFDELGETNISIFESPTRIGGYKIGELLGEGQFADVKLAVKNNSDKVSLVN